ncbi:hypothetical protein YC2023_093900 [Brassica napus]
MVAFGLVVGYHLPILQGEGSKAQSARRLSHTESWREGVVIHCRGRPHPRNRMLSIPEQTAP